MIDFAVAASPPPPPSLPLPARRIITKKLIIEESNHPPLFDLVSTKTVISQKLVINILIGFAEAIVAMFAG